MASTRPQSRGGKSIRKPALVAHADWSKDPKKRWYAAAVLEADGHYLVDAPRMVGCLSSYFRRLRGNLEADAAVLAVVIIDDATDPTEYRFDGAIPDGYTARIESDGMAVPAAAVAVGCWPLRRWRWAREFAGAALVASVWVTVAHTTDRNPDALAWAVVPTMVALVAALWLYRHRQPQRTALRNG